MSYRILHICIKNSIINYNLDYDCDWVSDRRLDMIQKLIRLTGLLIKITLIARDRNTSILIIVLHTVITILLYSRCVTFGSLAHYIIRYIFRYIT